MTVRNEDLHGILKKHADRVIDGLVLAEIETEFVIIMAGGSAEAYADGDGALHVEATPPGGEKIFVSYRP